MVSSQNAPTTLSTTGKPAGEDEDSRDKLNDGEARVSLVKRAAASSCPDLPDTMLIGGKGQPSAASIGRHEENDAVLALRSASKVHCQIALRSFTIPGQGKAVYEAAFLRDISRHGTLINGEVAYKPWHWLQHGDMLGLRERGTDAIVNFYEVVYPTHEALPSHLVKIEDLQTTKLSRPEGGAPAAKRTARQALKMPEVKVFGAEICGRIVDVHYAEQDPPETFRMRVITFDSATGWHRCDSNGLSTWDGDSFDDTIDLNKMFKEGNIQFFDEEGNPLKVEPQAMVAIPAAVAKKRRLNQARR